MRKQNNTKFNTTEMELLVNIRHKLNLRFKRQKNALYTFNLDRVKNNM